MDQLSEVLKERIVERALPDGGFAAMRGGQYRPDATAWAALALVAAGGGEDFANAARARLASDQMDDGRVSLSREHPESFWPTAPAVLAWHNAPEHRNSQQQGIDFLLASAGISTKEVDQAIVKHNALLRGWPWIEATHSWVEPTSLVLLALEVTGRGDHPRAEEARALLLDRQMDGGGWNYGNPAVFGRELSPGPASTGMALNALAGRADGKSVATSIAYLQQESGRLKTPLSLGWAALGLGAWGQRSPIDRDSVLGTLSRQEVYGHHRTEELSVLLIALSVDGGLLGIFRQGSGLGVVQK